MPSAVADRSCAFLTPQQGAEGTSLLSTLSLQVVPEELPSLWQPGAPLCKALVQCPAQQSLDDDWGPETELRHK